MIPNHIFIKVQNDFKRLNKDGDNVLNTEKDNIQLSDSAEFFIEFGKDIDLETFYQYNADKYGEKVNDEFNKKRQEISKFYKELADKNRPSLELEYRIDPNDNEAVNNFYRNPKEGMVYNFKGVDIKYENEQYFCPGTDYEPSKNIYGITFQIKQDLRNNFYNKYNDEFKKAKTAEEEEKITASFLKELPIYDGRLDRDVYYANYNPETELPMKITLGNTTLHLTYKYDANGNITIKRIEHTPAT